MQSNSSQSWAGEFFVPGSRQNRFAGEVKYSPDEGLILFYRFLAPVVVDGTKCLHGITSSGDQCTLVGPFRILQSEDRFGGAIVSRGGSVAFDAFLIGDCVSENEEYMDVSFSLTNLEEFFYPTGFKERVRLSDKPICLATTDFGEVSVFHTATLKFVHEIQDAVHCDDASAIGALEQAFKEVQESYPTAFFTTKADIRCRVVYEMAERCELPTILALIHDFSNLLALLTYRPVIPIDIKLRERIVDKPDLVVFRATYFERKMLEASVRDSFHWHMPIREPIVPLIKIIQKWFPVARDHSGIVSTIQNKARVRSEHDIHAQIVLHATQLESIGHAEGHKKDKYEYPLSKYGGEYVCDRLKKVFKKNTLNEVGVVITELRAEIAHVGRPKKWLTELSIMQVADIEQCFQLTVIGHLLEGIGVPSDAIHEYQFKYLPG